MPQLDCSRIQNQKIKNLLQQCKRFPGLTFDFNRGAAAIQIDSLIIIKINIFGNQPFYIISR